MGLFDFFNKREHEQLSNETSPASQTEPVYEKEVLNAALIDPQSIHFNEKHIDFIQDRFHRVLFKAKDRSCKPQIPTEELDEIAKRLIKDKAYRISITPTMPNIMPRLIQNLSDEDTPQRIFVDLISQDPVLAASVLKFSQSALYNPGGKNIESFERAIVLLGLSGLKMVACTCMLHTITHCAKSPVIKKMIWPKTLQTAIIMQHIAETEGNEPFLAYLSGLFQTIAQITFFEQFTIEQEHLLDSASYQYLLDHHQRDLCAAIYKDWGLPENIKARLKHDIAYISARKDCNEAAFLATNIAKLSLIDEKQIMSQDEKQNLLQELHINENYLQLIQQLSQSN